MSSQIYIWQYVKRNTGVCVKLRVISAVTGVTMYSKGQGLHMYSVGKEGQYKRVSLHK